MRMKAVLMAMLAVLALSAVSTAQAAAISWGPATTITADTDVLTTGSLAYAYHWVPGAVDATVNGVTFTGSTVLNGGTNVTVTAPHTGAVSGPLYRGRGLSDAFSSVLSGIVYDYDAGGHATTQVTLNNLTPGTPYSVQVFVQYPGYGYCNWQYSILDNWAAALQWSDINQEDGLGKYSIGTFTADASTQTFSVEAWDGSEGHYTGGAPINALQVRGPSVITIAGTPGSPADWATGTTWSINPAIPGAGDTPYVRHTVILAAASGPQTIAGLVLNNANSDLRIAAGASLTSGSTSVENGALTVFGALNSNLDVSGGTARLEAGSTGVGTLKASGGTSYIAANIGALEISGTGTVNTEAAVTIPTLTVSGGTLNLGLTAGNMSVTNATLSGTDIHTQGHYVLVSNTMNLAGQKSISITGAGSPSFGVKGDFSSAIESIDALKLNGGTVSISGYSVPTRLVIFPTPTSQAWASSQINATRGPEHTIDGSGLSGSPPGHDNGYENVIWDSNGTAGQWISWDLGSSMTLDKAHVWNGNRSGATNRGIRFADIQWSNDNSTWFTYLAGASLAQAPGTNGYLGFDDTDFAGITARYIRLNVTATWGATDRVDLSEIQFYERLSMDMNLSNTTVEVEADSVLELGGATSASFFDLFPMCPDGTVLRIQGAGIGVADSVASFFDISAPSAEYWTRTDQGTYAGGWWYELTYSGVTAIPEPAGLGLLGLALLAVRKRRS